MLPHVNSSTQEDNKADIVIAKQNSTKIKWYDWVLLHRPSKVVLVLVLSTIIAPVLIYHYIFFMNSDQPPPDGYSKGSCFLSRDARLPCGLGHMQAEDCHDQCCFDANFNICYHRFPSRFSYIVDGEWTENAIVKARIDTVPYASQSSIRYLKLSISEESPTHLTLTLYDSNNADILSKRSENKIYAYEVASPEMNIKVTSMDRTIFNTDRGPIIGADNIWEIAFHLTNESLYGLGEIPLKPDTVKVLYNHRDGLSSIPLIFAKVNTSYHGLLIDADSPTEVSIEGNNNIIVRSITTFGLKLHLFVGPRPQDIMNDARAVIGSKIKLDYWMLGAHICSETADSLAAALENLSAFIIDANSGEVPYESHCGVAPIVFNSNKCEVTEVIATTSDGINLLKQANKRFVPHVSPYLKFDVPSEGTNVDCYEIVSKYEKIFYRKPLSFEIYSGTVGESKVLYPNYYTAPVEFLKELWQYSDALDGVVLENSWPLDETINKTLNYTTLYLPYFNQSFETAFEETPQWNLTLLSNDTIYLQTHNNYGNHFASAFQEMLGKEVPTWTTSQKMNGGIAINRQKINASWTNLHKEIIKAALGGISGHWLWTSPICGDTENFDIENQASLCVKWYMASPYFPMIKIHSQKQTRDPSAFVGTHRRLIIEAMKRRLSLLPYLYTTLQQGPILRPMFYQFPESEKLANVSTQFSVGEDLVIVPNLQPLQSHVHFWMPPGTWYEILGGLKMEGEEGEPVTMSTTEADFLTLIRGGSILVTQEETKLTAEETRRSSPITLSIALECEQNNAQCQATGEVFITDTLSLNLAATESKLTIATVGVDVSPICDSSNNIMANTIHDIYIFGLKEELNNYDHLRHIQTVINLCNLEILNEFPLPSV